MRDLSKEFIVKNQDKTLKEIFPEAFDSFTGWAKTNTELSEDWLMYFKDNIIQYGFGGSGDWHINKKKEYQFNSDIDYKADGFEVKKRLKEEAKIRGLDKAVFFNHANTKRMTDGERCYLAEYSEGSAWNAYGCIYNEGEWAEIVDTMTKEEAEDKFNIVIR
jgi:hypothetical protein